jgi:hypothetical protein
MEFVVNRILVGRRQSATIMRAYALARNGGELKKRFVVSKGGFVVSAKTEFSQPC